MKIIKRILIRIFRIYEGIGNIYLKPILLIEQKYPPFGNINERPIEYGFAHKCLSETCPVEVLDVGTGTTAWPHIMANCGFKVTAIDKIEGYWKEGFSNRHYNIIHDDITKTKITKKFDLITCISVLEHISNHKEAIKGMFRLLKPGGHLVLTFPYNEKQYVDNVYKLPDAGYGQDLPYITQVFSRKEIDAWLKENPGKIIDQEYYQVFSGDLWTFGERICPPLKVKREEKHHLTCILIQKTE